MSLVGFNESGGVAGGVKLQFVFYPNPMGI